MKVKMFLCAVLLMFAVTGCAGVQTSGGDSGSSKGLTKEELKKMVISKSKIIITDNGIGINKSIISKVFDPFFTTKSEDKGTGLGLSISYGIISEMDGKIDIESKPNEFTKMTIQLPIV